MVVVLLVLVLALSVVFAGLMGLLMVIGVGLTNAGVAVVVVDVMLAGLGLFVVFEGWTPGFWVCVLLVGVDITGEGLVTAGVVVILATALLVGTELFPDCGGRGLGCWERAPFIDTVVVATVEEVDVATAGVMLVVVVVGGPATVGVCGTTVLTVLKLTGANTGIGTIAFRIVAIGATIAFVNT